MEILITFALSAMLGTFFGVWQEDVAAGMWMYSVGVLMYTVAFALLAASSHFHVLQLVPLQ